MCSLGGVIAGWIQHEKLQVPDRFINMAEAEAATHR
jgi:hypothetical protein